MQVCLSMYDFFLPPGLKWLRHFPAYYKFLDNFIEIWIKFGFQENKKDSNTQVYFQGGCINVLQITFFLKKNPYDCACQICIIDWKSVIEALNISSELQFQLTWRWHAPTCSSYLLLLSYQNQYIYFCYKLIISIPHLNQVYDKQRKKHFSVVICLYCKMPCFEIFISQDSIFKRFTGFTKK